MHCPYCGEPIGQHYIFCYNCGNKVQRTFAELRLVQRRSLRALKSKLKEYDICRCDDLISLCWYESVKKFHPNERTYCGDDNVPEYVFKEVQDTAVHAEMLFNMILPAIRSFQMIQTKK